MRPWIAGFVRFVGEQQAKELLQGAGLPRNYTAQTKEQWKSVIKAGEWELVNKQARL
jgi:hypothetical protein